MERSSRPAESHQDPAQSQRPAAGISDPLFLQIWSCLSHTLLLLLKCRFVATVPLAQLNFLLLLWPL